MNCRSALRGFTLVELIVAVGLLAIVLLLLASMTNSTASIWRLTSGKIEEFRSAGNAFDALTRRLSQATLNTYWDTIRQPPPRRISATRSCGSSAVRQRRAAAGRGCS